MFYSKRWGIETSYRMIKYFRSKTTSKNPVVRLFHFLFGVCLYNLWQLANLKGPIVPGQITQKYDIPAKIFGNSVLRVIRMMGTGPPEYRFNQSLGPPAFLAG